MKNKSRLLRTVQDKYGRGDVDAAVNKYLDENHKRLFDKEECEKLFEEIPYLGILYVPCNSEYIYDIENNYTRIRGHDYVRTKVTIVTESNLVYWHFDDHNGGLARIDRIKDTSGYMVQGNMLRKGK